MSVRLNAQQIENQQRIEAAVAGPDGATRLFVFAGLLQADIATYCSAAQTVSQTQTFTVLIGPVLSRRQFVQAIATAAIAGTSTGFQTLPAQFSSQINGVDADWDDESGQVNLSIEVSVSATGTMVNNCIQKLSFQVTILAAIDQQ